MKTFNWMVLIAVGLASLSLGQTPPAEPIESRASLDQRIAALLPKAQESRYLEISWRTDLMAARRESIREGKPIFLWIMNGSPLGCT